MLDNLKLTDDILNAPPFCKIVKGYSVLRFMAIDSQSKKKKILWKIYKEYYVLWGRENIISLENSKTTTSTTKTCRLAVIHLNLNYVFFQKILCCKTEILVATIYYKYIFFFLGCFILAGKYYFHFHFIFNLNLL